MMTATAKSTTLPRMMKSLNPFNIVPSLQKKALLGSIVRDVGESSIVTQVATYPLGQKK
jgi:hypothetical protein